MNLIDDLKSIGFSRITVLDGCECSIEHNRIILCFVFYQACGDTDDNEAVIHPYYPVSQAYYLKTRSLVTSYMEKGFRIKQNDRIPIKTILERLAFIKTGINTLAYMENIGSRFHVQILTSDEDMPVTDHLMPEKHHLECVQCGKCIDACLTGAIGMIRFNRELCIRNWMLNGKVPPDKVINAMGNRLIGCDDCQQCCPMNSKDYIRPVSFSLETLLSGSVNDRLSELIGNNLAIRNRVIIQACAIAASCKRKDLKDTIEGLLSHPSEAVRNTAEKSLEILAND